MSISTYSELKTAVANWLRRSDMTTYIPDLIRLGEARIYRQLRIKAMEASISEAISSGIVAVPSGYVAMKHAYIDGSSVSILQRKDAEWIYANYPTRAADGKPAFIARESGNFIFGPYPDTGYTMKGVYYKRLDALSDSNTTNTILTDSPDLLLFAALCEAAPFIKDDERILIWEQKYKMVKDDVQDEDRRENVSSSTPLAMSAR